MTAAYHILRDPCFCSASACFHHSSRCTCPLRNRCGTHYGCKVGEPVEANQNTTHHYNSRNSPVQRSSAPVPQLRLGSRFRMCCSQPRPRNSKIHSEGDDPTCCCDEANAPHRSNTGCPLEAPRQKEP